MEKNEDLNENNPSNQLNQDEIMNRVNQTFDKISQEVKSMLDDNQNGME